MGVNASQETTFFYLFAFTWRFSQASSTKLMGEDGALGMLYAFYGDSFLWHDWLIAANGSPETKTRGEGVQEGRRLSHDESIWLLRLMTAHSYM